MDKKLINIVKGDINTAIQNGSYNRNTAYQTNIEFNTPTKQILLDGDPYSNPSLTKVTWQELKDLRDNNKLVAGSFYRITDYQCTTTQENTRSAGHQFDIVLLALSENKLAEEGWATINERELLNATFSDGITKKCWIYRPQGQSQFNIVDAETLLGASVRAEYISRDIENKTAEINISSNQLITASLDYNYFCKSNLSAWRVWYCLDNDKSRFAWTDERPYIIDSDNGFQYYRAQGDDEEGYYAWYTPADDINVYTQSETPSTGDSLWYKNNGEIIDYDGDKVTWFSLIGEGRGVIYRLIDEWNNDVGYDFKNIQYVRKLTNGTYDPTNGTNAWVYTLNVWYDNMCQDASIVGNILTNDEYMVTGVYNNLIEVIGGYLFHGQNARQALSDNCVLSDLDEDHHYYGIQNCSIDASSISNTISSENSSIENICLKWSSRNKIKGIGAIFMDCYDFNYNSDRGGIYIQKKRVLTES